MRTKMNQVGDTLIVSLEGLIDFETSIPFREDLARILKLMKPRSPKIASSDHAPPSIPARRVIFDLQRLEFVGSSGISNFIHALREFNETAPERPRLCHLKSEFQRMFRAMDDAGRFVIVDTQADALESYSVAGIPPLYGRVPSVDS